MNGSTKMGSKGVEEGSVAKKISKKLGIMEGGKNLMGEEKLNW